MDGFSMRSAGKETGRATLPIRAASLRILSAIFMSRTVNLKTCRFLIRRAGFFWLSDGKEHGPANSGYRPESLSMLVIEFMSRIRSTNESRFSSFWSA